METMGNSVENGVQNNNFGYGSIEIALITGVPRPTSYSVQLQVVLHVLKPCS